MQQRKEYDRCTLLDKRRQGHSYTHSLLKGVLEGSGGNTSDTAEPGPSQVKPRVPSTSSKSDDKGFQLPVGGEYKDSDEEEEDELPEKGDIVARVLPGSTMHNPLVSVGKVYKVDPLQRLVYISVFQRVDQAKQLYRSELLGTRDKVPASEVAHPLDTHYIGQGGLYELRTPLKDIHRLKGQFA